MTATEPQLGPYRPLPGFHDEAVDADGALRLPEGIGAGLAAREDLEGLAEAVRDAVAAQGVGFRSVGGATHFPVDPVPRVLGGAEFADLEAGLMQRVRALNAFVADVYGTRHAIAEGVIPARVVDTSIAHEPTLRGLRPPGDLWVGIAGLDLVRGADGELRVLEDNLMTPSGFAYAVAARRAVVGALDPPDDARPLPLEPFVDMLAGTLRSAAPDGRDPSIVVLTDGPDNSAAWEHAWAAEALGVPLVTPDELSISGDRLMRDGATVDVVYRRTDADRVETEVGALLMGPLRAGTLGLVNGFGTGVADDKLAHAYVEEMIRFHLGEEPLLRSVETLDLGRSEHLERALDELDELVIKPRRGHGGIGVVVCPHATRADVDAIRAAVRAAPEDYVAQPLVAISLHPTVIDGALHPRHVDLRPFVFLRATGEAQVMPGGLTRVAFGEGAMVVNSTQNGGAKDTWVVP